MTEKVKIILKYLLIVILGIVLATVYSYIINHDFSLGLCVFSPDDFSIEVIIVFFALYIYMILFVKLLIRLFK